MGLGSCHGPYPLFAAPTLQRRHLHPGHLLPLPPVEQTIRIYQAEARQIGALERLHQTSQTNPEEKGLEGPPPAKNPQLDNPQLDNPRAQANFHIPTLAKYFVQRNGRLRTTPDVWQFLHETGIEYNNSKALRIWLGPEHKRITTNFSCNVQYSPEYILHPYHLQYLTPHQHPLTSAMMAQYRQKLVDRQLWIYTLNRGGFTGVVKEITQRRLTGALASALEDLGHPGTGIRGTVIITLNDVLKAAHNPAHLFGQGVAQAIDREWKQHLWRKKSDSARSPRAQRFGQG
ncbi:hypothetical protein CEP52_015657 [Fusarium oligoseptatum]|uniref:Uncharacterized protein n=1 Tax=Fusarium oligoseptatum TaxID=2604345 RepID=A0A428SB29_9HYPO|nr:hypothetical protein CEP52_015657 [Fusarium oligoseptatum]